MRMRASHKCSRAALFPAHKQDVIYRAVCNKTRATATLSVTVDARTQNKMVGLWKIFTASAVLLSSCLSSLALPINTQSKESILAMQHILLF